MLFENVLQRQTTDYLLNSAACIQIFAAYKIEIQKVNKTLSIYIFRINFSIELQAYFNQLSFIWCNWVTTRSNNILKKTMTVHSI